MKLIAVVSVNVLVWILHIDNIQSEICTLTFFFSLLKNSSAKIVSITQEIRKSLLHFFLFFLFALMKGKIEKSLVDPLLCYSQVINLIVFFFRSYEQLIRGRTLWMSSLLTYWLTHFHPFHLLCVLYKVIRDNVGLLGHNLAW